MGHSLLCFTGDECNSKLRILRAASTHYAVLRSFVHAVYDAIRNHKCVAHLDAALHSGDFTYLMRACEIDSYESLLSNEVQSTYQLSVYELDSPLRKPNLEYELQTTHARIMALYDKVSMQCHFFATSPILLNRCKNTATTKKIWCTFMTKL